MLVVMVFVVVMAVACVRVAVVVMMVAAGVSVLGYAAGLFAAVLIFAL